MDLLYDLNREILISGLREFLQGLELQTSLNFPVWFSAATRLAKIYFEISNLLAFECLISRMRSSCQKADGSTDFMSKAVQLMDLYALEIRWIEKYSTADRVPRMKQVLRNAHFIQSAVCNPRSAGILRECAGKIHMIQRKYEDAYNEFFESFKLLLDIGLVRSKTLLKYAVLANICSLSRINPFDSREARALQHDPDMVDIFMLRRAVDEREFDVIETILKDNRFSNGEDMWLHDFIDLALEQVKLSYLQHILPAYRSVDLSSLSTRVHSPMDSTKLLAMRSILDGEFAGRINKMRVIIDGPSLEHGTLNVEIQEISHRLCAFTDGLHEKIVTVGNK
jgi:COP9 signalosome complex subunit 2